MLRLAALVPVLLAAGLLCSRAAADPPQQLPRGMQALQVRVKSYDASRKQLVVEVFGHFIPSKSMPGYAEMVFDGFGRGTVTVTLAKPQMRKLVDHLGPDGHADKD